MPITYSILKAASPENNQPPISHLVQLQRNYFASGATLSLKFRMKQLRALQQAIQQHEQALFDALEADFRKSDFETYITEIGLVQLELRHALDELPDWTKPKHVKETYLNFPSHSYVYPNPYGLVLIFGSWYYPLNHLLIPLIGALAAGNCVLLKLSDTAPNTAAALAKLLHSTFEAAYVGVVEGGPETVSQLLKQPLDHIFYIGNKTEGKQIMMAAAEQPIPVMIELGGKNPTIVAEDADLSLAARRIVWGKFLNAGQSNVAPDYVLVHEQVKEELVQVMIYYIQKFYGEYPQESPDYARIINTSHFDRLMDFIKQGTVRHGGQADKSSLFIAPTLLDQISWEQPIMQEEILGPIMPILPYSNLREAIQLVNTHDKPLALYFFSNSHKKIAIVQRCVQYGGGCINDTVSHLANPRLPIGGVGSSGMGRYHGKSSFELFSYQKSMLHRGTWLDLAFRYPPYLNRLPMLRRIFRWVA